MDTYQRRSDDLSTESPIQCAACRDTLFASGQARDGLSFLLVA